MKTLAIILIVALAFMLGQRFSGLGSGVLYVKIPGLDNP